MPTILTGADVFDGTALHRGADVLIDGAQIVAIGPGLSAPGAERVALPGGTLAPAFVDLQVNGGGGAMIGAETDALQMRRICALHRAEGSAGILPTLITDRPEVTRQVIAAGIALARDGAPGFLGLHLEGPHLDPRRKGAHDPALIRPMTDDDLAELCEAATRLPALMVTVAPESVTADQISRLAGTGAIVSLGHTDCRADQARAAIAAGAVCATHLFNAMSQLGNREPGMVGAVLGGTIACGQIADGIHVAPDVMRLALRLRTEGVFLVSDCMAFAGTSLDRILLGGREIRRSAGRLELADGSLAGADLRLDRAIAVLIGTVGIAPERAMAMATAIPAALIGAQDRVGHLLPGRTADIVHLDADWRLTGLWLDGAHQGVGNL